MLAHPWVGENVLIKKNIKKYIKAGLKGIALENGDFNRFGRDKKTVALIKKLAKKYNLILMQGSDFHGPIMSKDTRGHELGKSNCDEKIVEQLEKLRLTQVK